jgi:hypothetical protein
MKRSAVNEIVPEEKEAIATLPKNGSKNGKSKTPEEIDLTAILTSLQSMRDGDFSVRLPGTWVGLAGKIADTFNDIVSANQHMSEELKRVGQVVGKQGMNPGGRGARWKFPSTRWSRTCSGLPLR